MNLPRLAKDCPKSLKVTLSGASARLADKLCTGMVYRREDLARLSNAVDRHLRILLSAGKLHKLAAGLYHVPRNSKFGPLPASDEQLVRAFLRDDDFLVFSPSLYNSVGLGTTQLYNKTLVYNHKRHGLFKLGNRQFDLRVKPRFPEKITPEFLYVDLLNNLDELAEDRDLVLARAQEKLAHFDASKLSQALKKYGNMATRKRIQGWITPNQLPTILLQ
jgi:hypothetical protein